MGGDEGQAPSVRRPDRSDEPLPLTLVVPVRDEESSIDALVASIDAQVRPPAEVVFVDGGSTDHTVAVLRRKAEQDSRYRVVEAGPATPGRGRNVGVAAARQGWVAMTDAGITLDPDWLSALWDAHEAHPSADVVYGNFEFDLRSFFEECAAVAYGDPKHETPAGRCRGPVVVSCLMSVEAFCTAGGFLDSRSGEDEAFVRAVAAHGLEVAWAPAATVRWRLRTDLLSTLERFRSYSYHYVLAGQAEHWHRPLARSYVPVAVGTVAALLSPRWLLLPTVTVAARVVVRVGRHQPDMSELRAPGPARLGLIALVLVSTDAATAVGWWQARRHLRRQARRGAVRT